MAGETMKPRYTVVIQWSDEDRCYIASLPEWGPYASAHGETYEQAARNAEDVLELLMADEDGRPADLPAPRLFHYPGADVVDVSESAVGALRREATAAPDRQTA